MSCPLAAGQTRVVERALGQLLDRGEPFDYAEVQKLAAPPRSDVPHVDIGEPDLGSYDELLEAHR